jgi:hypothetical protein
MFLINLLCWTVHIFKHFICHALFCTALYIRIPPEKILFIELPYFLGTPFNETSYILANSQRNFLLSNRCLASLAIFVSCTISNNEIFILDISSPLDTEDITDISPHSMLLA